MNPSSCRNVLLVTAALSFSVTAQEQSGSAGDSPAQAAHVHGTANLQVQVSDQQLEVRFQTPAINIVEFEQAPQTDEQRERVTTAEQNLRDASKVLELDASAGCELKSADVQSGLSGNSSGDVQGAGNQGGEHADFTAVYQFNCKNPGQLGSFQVNAFRFFKGISIVQAQWRIGPSQGSAELNQTKNEVILTQ